MSDIEPHKLKVTELRDELKKRGLDTKGKKEQLVKRLMQALGMDDAGADDLQTNIEDSDVSQLCDVSVTAGDVTTGEVAAGDVTAGEVAADGVAAGGVAADGVAADGVAAGEVAADGLVAGEVAADGLVASEVAADGIAADGIAADVVAARGGGREEQHAADAVVNGDDLAVVTSGNLVAAGAVDADQAGGIKEEAGPEVTASVEQPISDAIAEQRAAVIPGDGCTSQSTTESVLALTDEAADERPAVETDVDMAAAVESPSEPTTGSAQYTLPASESSVSMSSSQQSTEDAVPTPAEDRPAASQVDLVAAGDVAMADDADKTTLASACGDGEKAAAGECEPDVKMEQEEDAPVHVQEPPSTDVKTNLVAEGSSNNGPADKINGSGDQLPASRDRSRSPRRRSRSPVQQRQRSPQIARSADDESWILSDEVQLDRYNSDLNMVIKDNYTAVPLCQAGFAYMWAGAKATYGVISGKVAFEFKITEEVRVDLPADEKFPNVARVGWSLDSGSTQLGEDSTSWGYGGTGKASHDDSFKYYGQPFAKDDVITAYLDVDSSPVVISFSKNGSDMGVAYEIEKSLLKGQALFPTVLCKNTEVTLNFGHKEAAFPLREGYTFIGQVPPEQRFRAVLPPAKKSDAEVLMLIGLPGSGKTYWAAKHCEAHPEKRYNVLGTNAIIDKMKVPLDMISVRKIKVYFNRELLDLRREKRMLERRFKKKQDLATGATYKIVVAEYKAKIKRVMGLQRKYNYSGRWDVLFDRSNQCLTKLIDLASSKQRNYIIDQTNVYGTAQKRKMRPFEGFRRKAVVIVPSDDEFLSRTVKRTKEEGKAVPDDAVLEMKANFSIPSVGEVFDEVLFAELPEADTRKLVAQYVKEGQVKFPPGSRRFNDRRSGPEQQAGGGIRDAGRGRGYPGPRDGFRNDKPGYGDSYRSGGGSGFHGGGSSFGNNRYEDRNSRPERGYYVQSPSSGSREFGGGQNQHPGGSGSYSTSTKPYNAATQPAQPPGGSWTVGSGRPSAPVQGNSGTQPAGHWGTGWSGNQPQQAAWGNNYGAGSSGTSGSAPVGQANSYGSGYRAQASSYDSQPGDYSTRSAGHVNQSGGFYGAQSGSFSAQSGGYSAQSGGYSAQSGGYSAQSGGYGSQSGGYGAPASSYGAQSGGYGAQAGGYSTQPGSYGSQASGYGTQPGGYSTPSGGIGAQSGGYDSQSRGYGAQSGSYANQARSYANQAGGYGSPTGSSVGSYNTAAASYSSPAASSSSQGRSYGSTSGYGQGQGAQASWPVQQHSLPPSRPQATAAPQWGQQKASGAASWQQSSYSQRR